MSTGRDARWWRLVGVFALVTALVLAASLLATSMARIEIAEDAEVQLKANEVLVFAWTANALLNQAEFLTEQAAASQADPTDAAAAISEVRTARDQYHGAVRELAAVAERGDAIAALGATAALDRAIAGLEAGSTAETAAAASQLQKAIELADGERILRAEEIAASADRAGQVAIAARWLVAIILPGIAILAVRWNQRRIAEQLRLEAELETERAVQASKNQFVNAVLHHLRTPMSAVLGFAETLRSERHRFNARQRNDMIETIAEQAADLGYLMEDLRVFSRPDDQLIPLEITDCDLRRSTETVLTGLEMQHVDYVTVTGYAEASADPKRLRQILRHLIANAREHGRSGVWITIGRGGDRSWVEVVDDGPGLGTEADGGDLHGVITGATVTGGDESSTLKVGVGLRLSMRLAHQMGGSLEYRREEDRSVFRLSVPGPSGVASADRVSGPDQISTADIVRVLETGDFEVALQPIFSMAEPGRVDGYEALSRFPRGTPAEWLKAAERSGMIVDFELTTIRRAVAEAAGRVGNAYLALNVSTDTLLSSELLEACGDLDPSRVVFELSEDATVANYERTVAAVEQLVDRGYRLALDDVGTGEMDLWHVVRLNPQIVKLDMSLIDGIDQADNLAIIESIIATALRLGAKTIAEGVETADQLDRVRRLGIDAVQGFFLGQPFPPDEAPVKATTQSDGEDELIIDLTSEVGSRAPD